jgi:CheY-specific phosphatase CheX
MENTKKIQEHLMNSIFEVFEKMFFVFLEPVDEDVKYDMIASINFIGLMNGSIDVFFTLGVAETMVQNMLGGEAEGVTPTLIEDCAKEAVNMVGGNFLQKYDSSNVFNLSIPIFNYQSGIFAMQEEVSGGHVWNLSFESSEGLMGVRMSIS